MKICVLGDSHCKVFSHCNSDTMQFDVVAVIGATAQGCLNPNNETNSLNIFKKHILKSSIYDKVFIMLGEVDCGYLVWVRSKRHNISVESQIELCIENIGIFISDVLLTNGYNPEQIILCGAHIPTIKDNTDNKYLSGARSEVDVSQYERTMKTHEYNKLLEELSNKNGYKYIDITKFIMGEDNVVNPYYLNKNPWDHHLDNNKIASLWENEIHKILK